METITLVFKEKNNKLKINEDALVYLKKIKESFGVCVCVGPYRQGKSFLLNAIVKKQDAFKIGHTDRSCTKGITMLKNLIKIKNKYGIETNVLFLDTEGLESDDSDELWDSMLFLVSLLLSSLFIYNTKNALTADAFKKLAVITDISRNIKLNENQKTLKNDGPRFVWVVRDYSLASTMSAEERLENFLKLEKENSDDDSDTKRKKNERNRLRISLKENFKSSNCFYLPVPVADGVNGLTFEEAVQSLDIIDFDKLRSAFKTAFKNFKIRFDNLIELKKINQNTINGSVFAEYLKQIVENLNKNKIIHLHEVISSSYDAAIQSVLDDMKTSYISKMDDLGSNDLPLKKDDFDKQELFIYKNVTDFLKQCFPFESDLTSKTLDLFNKFRVVKNSDNHVIGGKWLTYYEMNQKQIESKNNQIAIKYWDAEMKPMLYPCIKFFSKSIFDFELILFKRKLKKKLFECEEFDLFWNDFSEVHIELNKIKSNLEFHFQELDKKKLEKEREAKKIAEDAKEIDHMKKQLLEQRAYLNYLKNTIHSSNTNLNNKYEPVLPPKRFNYYDKPNSEYNTRNEFKNDSYSKPTIIHLKNDGTPDMRYSENRARLVRKDGTRININGTPDMRYLSNRKKYY